MLSVDEIIDFLSSNKPVIRVNSRGYYFEIGHHPILIMSDDSNWLILQFGEGARLCKSECDKDQSALIGECLKSLPTVDETINLMDALIGKTIVDVENLEESKFVKLSFSDGTNFIYANKD